MLSPNQRELLLDALRPDPDFLLDQAVGTTFSLDLDALLTAPLAFALFDVDMGEGDPDPIAIIAAVKSYASRMAIYCDAAKICVPNRERPLLALLESMVRPVSQPGGSFHPKVWVLRYRATGGRELRHRVIVLSRNLTFDRSWDTVLRLDEDLERSGAVNSRELIDFLRKLQSRAPSTSTAELLRTLPRCRFSPPEGFDDLRFWPLLGDGVDPIAGVEASQALVVSPFITGGRLSQLRSMADRCALVTRADALDELGGAALEDWQDVFVLRGEAMEDLGASRLSGLHAKLYLFDDKKRRRLFTGSANATAASTEHNVEFMVELTSSESATRIERLMKLSDKEVTFRSLLEARRPERLEPAEKTPQEIEEERLEHIAKLISAQPVVATARTDEQHNWVVDLELDASAPPLAQDDRLKARLVTASTTWASVAMTGGVAHAELRAGDASRVTRLIAFELTGDSELAGPERWVMVADLRGAPEDREQRLLLEIISDSDKLMKLLFLLLASGRAGHDAAAEVRRLLTEQHTNGDGRSITPSMPLFENLVRTFAREPERLRSVGGVIEHLRQTEEGRRRFPPGFLDLWATFEAALPAGRKS